MMHLPRRLAALTITVLGLATATAAPAFAGSGSPSTPTATLISPLAVSSPTDPCVGANVWGMVYQNEQHQLVGNISADERGGGFGANESASGFGLTMTIIQHKWTVVSWKANPGTRIIHVDAVKLNRSGHPYVVSWNPAWHSSFGAAPDEQLVNVLVCAFNPSVH